jgi:hypothetical protein
MRFSEVSSELFTALSLEIWTAYFDLAYFSARTIAHPLPEFNPPSAMTVKAAAS